jgi:hypothetical protein
MGASYQVSVHLAEGFQRRRLKCEKLTDDERQVMAKAHLAFGKVSLKKNYPRNISARFDFKWFSGFREELFKIAQVQSGLLFNYVIPLQLW